MAKLPTLNVDVAVNTKTMQKGIADANKQLQQVGGKVLSAGGGLGAKLGSLGTLGGGLGPVAMAIGGVMMAAMAPFKAARAINQSFVDAVADSKKALDAWNTSAMEGTRTGISRTVAERMAAQEERAAGAEGAWSGLGTAFFGAAAGEGGALGGVASSVATWAEEMGRGTKSVLGFFGALAGGKSAAQAEVEMLMAAEPENADRLKGWLAEVQQGKDVYHMPTDDEITARVRSRAAELDAIANRQMQQQQELFG
jgi:hypothetical protein